MPEFEPTRLTPPDTGPDDPRVGHFLAAETEEKETRVAILGFPCDEGVVRNNGRAGAAQGPDALRRCLYRFTPDPTDARMTSLLRRSRDLGDLAVSGELEADQQSLGEAVAEILDAGTIPVVLGGGHETAYGHFLGYAGAGLPVAISNVDAHADVRELRNGQGHSGSPFRQALEHESGLCREYRVAGLQPQSNSRAHIQYLDTHNCRYWFRTETDQEVIAELYPDKEGDRYATFCLDALDAAFAPGVSAPASDGLHPEWWLAAAYRAGASERVRSFDVVELNPGYDVDQRTARIAALTVWHFLRGVSRR